MGAHGGSRMPSHSAWVITRLCVWQVFAFVSSRLHTQEPFGLHGVLLAASTTLARKRWQVAAMEDFGLSPDQLPDGNAIQGLLEALEKHCTDCERSHRYEEAEQCRARLEQLKMHEESRRREDLRKQQLKERLSVEQAHMQELQEFNEMWDRKAAEFKAHADNLQGTLAERHKREHQAYLDKLRRETEPRTPRWSKECGGRSCYRSAFSLRCWAETSKTSGQQHKTQQTWGFRWKATPAGDCKRPEVLGGSG